FSFDDEIDWIYNTIDAIEPGEVAGMPEMGTMLQKKSLTDVIADDKLSAILPGVIKNEYRSCLPRLAYPENLTDDATKARSFYTKQVEILDKLLMTRNGFLEGLTKALTNLMSKYTTTFSTSAGAAAEQPGKKTGGNVAVEATLPWFVLAAENQA